MMLKLIKNKDLIYDVLKYDVVLVSMNINNSMNKGFKYDISLSFPDIRKKEMETPYGDRRKYGTVLAIESNKTIFCICYMYEIPYNRKNKVDFVKYDALEKCLKDINNKFKGMKIASTVMGNDKYEGNGNYSRIMETFKKCCNDLDITLYDYQQTDRNTEFYKMGLTLLNEKRNKKISDSDYKEKHKRLESLRKNGFHPINTLA